MVQNFTEIVQPFLRMVDASPMESAWPIVNLAPKALIGIFLFPNTVPEVAMHNMNMATFLFYYYCTQHIQQCLKGFFFMSLCLFFMYRAPHTSFRYIDASSWYMTMVVTACHPGCEFSLDVFLMVSFSFWLVKKFENETVKHFFVMWFTFAAYFLPTIRVVITERRKYLNDSVENGPNASDFVTASVVNVLNLNNSITAPAVRMPVDEL